MQHTELGMKSIMLESCMDTGDWPSAFRARIFLVNRYPKIETVGMALMGRDKIWPDVEPATVTTKNKAIK